MRKFLFVLSIVIFLASCGNTEYHVSITNNSSKTVKFDYNNISNTLSLSETKTYVVPPYTQAPKNFVDQYGIASIKMKTDEMTGNYDFSNAPPPFNLNVVNTLPIIVKIRADNYINDNNSPELTIDEISEKTTAKIYTKTPNFESLIDHPITIDWNFEDNTVFVIIR